MVGMEDLGSGESKRVRATYVTDVIDVTSVKVVA